MPELPEVETVRRLIRPALEGRAIVGTSVAWERSLGGISRRAFAHAVRGARAHAVRRRGKFVVIELTRDGEAAGALLVHLRMSGRLHVDASREPPRPYTRVVCQLDDGRELRFVDVRKFGRFRYAPRPEEVLSALGPEPLGREFTAGWLQQALRSRRRLLKPLLLDQGFLAGLGNISVDEALFRARLHPLVRSDEIGRARATRLWRAIRAILREAIEREGSSFDSFYLTPEGQPGSYQERFRVYGRAGRPCPTCGRRIARTVVGQRGTHVCTRCQRKPRARA